MKRIFIKTIAALSLTMSASTAFAADNISEYLTPFSEGVQYTTLKKQVPEASTLREVFSVYCPHCYKLEPIIQKIKPDLNADIKVKRHHVDFLRSAKKEEQSDVTKAILIADEIGKADEFVAFAFTAIHEHRQLPERDGLEALLATLGVPKDQVSGAWDRPDVLKSYNKLAKMQREWVESGDVKGVPTLIVNGKYRVELGGIKAKSSEEFLSTLTSLINYLTVL
jgi:thiol:disulfide interchange protein DsbA|tara:strand:+ start:10156 stop:10827 length:672 start_codon:yes stop_codon:yes gene_type:complete